MVELVSLGPPYNPSADQCQSVFIRSNPCTKISAGVRLTRIHQPPKELDTFDFFVLTFDLLTFVVSTRPRSRVGLVQTSVSSQHISVFICVLDFQVVIWHE